MKTRILIIFIFSFFFINQTFSQWSVSSNTTLQNYLSINAVHFLNENIGFMGGTNDFINGDGRISKTINGGSNWKVVLVESNAAINDIFFLNNTVGFAVGHSGLIAKTVDAGETWTTQKLASGASFRAVYFTDASTGYIVGGTNNEVAYKTTDAGSSWTPISGFAGAHRLNDIFFANANTGVAVGGDQFSGSTKIYRTTNSGISWDSVSYSPKTYFESVHFVDANIGFIGGGLGTILKTTNGGATWIQVTNQDVSKGAVTAIDFINSTSGFATTQTGKILKTTDGGNLWTLDASVTNHISSLYDISVLSPTKGYATGLSGTYAVKMNSTGIEQPANFFKISPNPTNNKINITLETTVENGKLTVFNMNGQIIFEKNNLNQNNTIKLPEMAEGIYILTIQHSKGNFQQKLVISK